jgi:site-specific DNA recombinase
MTRFPSCPLPPGSPVWAYLRISTDDQDITSQRNYVLDYCKHNRLILIRIFEDVMSGGQAANRDEFQSMVAEARRHSKPVVSGILYWDVKRFARNKLESDFYSAELKLKGYKLISLSDNIPEGPVGDLLEGLLRWKAQQDLDDISKDTKRGHRDIIRMRDENGNYLGLAPGTPPPCFKGIPYNTGLVKKNGQVRIVQRWIPDPDTWELGKLAWQMRADRATYTEIQEATGLYEKGFNNNRRYSYFFRNRIYLGEYNYGGEVYKNFVPALVDPDTWAKAQEYLYHRPTKGQKHPAGKVHPKEGRGTQFLLTGICYCDYCGTKMYGNWGGKPKWYFYICNQLRYDREKCPESRRANSAKLDQAIVDFARSLILTPAYVEELIEEVNNLLTDSNTVEAKIDRQYKKIADLEKAIENLLQALELGTFSVKQRLAQRETELQQALREMEQLQANLQRVALRIDKSVISAVLSDMEQTLTGEEFRAKQRLLQRIVPKVEFKRMDSYKIYYRFPVHLLGDWFDPGSVMQLIPLQVYEVSNNV